VHELLANALVVKGERDRTTDLRGDEMEQSGAETTHA